MAMSDHDIAVAKGMLARGDKQQDIAAWFGTNSGRIAEINTGARGAGVEPIGREYLPPPGPYSAARREPRDIISTALEAAAIQLTELAAAHGRAMSADALQQVRQCITRLHAAMAERKVELFRDG